MGCGYPRRGGSAVAADQAEGATRNHRRGAAGTALALLALVALPALAATTCGDGESARPRSDAFYRQHPYSLTCEQVLAMEYRKARQFHIAAFALAGEVRLPDTTRNLIWERLVFALLDICKGGRRSFHRPAAEAVREVGRGKYVLGEPSQPKQRR
jgi:hypothetical protein